MNYLPMFWGATNLDELALKERHLTGQSVRAVTLMMFFLVSAVGATPNKYNRCRSFRPHPLKTIYMTALTDCPVRCRTFGAFRRTHVKVEKYKERRLMESPFIFS